MIDACCTVHRKGAKNESTFNKVLEKIFRVHHIHFLVMNEPSGEPQVIFHITVVIISVAVLGLLYVTYDFCHRVNTVTPDPINRVDSSVEPPGVTGLKPEEKQKIFKRILVGKVCKRGWQ